MSAAAASAPDVRDTVDVIVFRVGERRFAADASQVRRIARAGHFSRLSDRLGMPSEGTRALVFSDETESELCIDAVEGVRAAPVRELRRLPLAAGRVDAVLGLWLEDGERPLVLVDLFQTLEPSGGSS